MEVKKVDKYLVNGNLQDSSQPGQVITRHLFVAAGEPGNEYIVGTGDDTVADLVKVAEPLSPIVFTSKGMDDLYPMIAATGKLFDSLVETDKFVVAWAKQFINYPLHVPLHLKVKSVNVNTDKNTVAVILNDRHKVTRSVHLGTSDQAQMIEEVWPADHCFVLGLKLSLKNPTIVPHADDFKSASSVYNSPDIEVRIEQYYDTTSKEVLDDKNYFP